LVWRAAQRHANPVDVSLRASQLFGNLIVRVTAGTLAQRPRRREIGGQFCPSDTITYGQEQKIVLKYLNDHPEKLHLPSTFLVREAFRGAFPCPTKKAKAHPTATSH
jgi:hypothetical protein